ncbi:MAG: VOC family protein [Pseudonocardiaceae bacterium]
MSELLVQIVAERPRPRLIPLVTSYTGYLVEGTEPGLHRGLPIRFLVKAFGFAETLVVPGDREGEIVHAELRWPEGGGIMFGSGEGKFAVQPGNVALYVVTDQPDALFERATAAGAEVVRGLSDEDYGSRGFTVRDPEGNLWSFGTYRGA